MVLYINSFYANKGMNFVHISTKGKIHYIHGLIATQTCKLPKYLVERQSSKLKVCSSILHGGSYLLLCLLIKKKHYIHATNATQSITS